MSMHIGDAILRILGDTHDVEAKIDALGGRIKGLAPTAAKVVVGGLAATLAATAASAIKGSIAFAGFEDSMLNTRTIAKMSDDEFSSLSQQVIDLSKQFPESTGGAEQLAAALYQAVSSGIPAGNAMEFLKTAAEGATAGATSTSNVVQALAGTLNAYHLSADQAQHVSDVLFQTVNLGVVDMEDLSGTLSNVSAVAAAAGVSLEETGAGIATMTKQNIPAAEATTDLRSAIEAIVNANKPLLGVLNANGYATGQAALKSLGLEGTLNLLHETVGDNTQGWFELLPRIEGVQAALALTGQNSKQAASDLDAMTHASDGAGAAHEAFEIKEKGLSDAWEKMLSKAHALALEMGGRLAPAAHFVIDQISALLDGTSPLSPLFETVGNVIKTVVSGIVTAVTQIGPVIGDVAATVGDVIGTLSKVFTGIGNTVDGAMGKGTGAFRKLHQVAMIVLPPIQSIFKAVFDAAAGAVRWFTTVILPPLSRWMQQIVAWVNAHWPEISGTLQVVGAIAKIIIDGFIQTFQLALDAISHVWPAIQAVIETVMSVISGIISVILDIISGHWDKIWTDVQTMLVGVWNGILDFIGSIPSLIVGILEGLLVAVMVWAGAFAGKVLGWAGGFFGRFIGWFAKIPGDALGAIGGLPGRLLGFLGDLLGRVIGWLGDLVGKFVKFFADTPGKAVNALASLPGKIVGFLLGIPGKIASAAVNIGAHIISGIVDGITGAVGNAVSSVTGAVGNIVGGIGNFLGIHSPSRVFAEIGRQSMLGLAEGLSDEGAAMRALQGSVGNIIKSNPLSLAVKRPDGTVQPLNFYGDIYLPDVTDFGSFVSGMRHMATSRASG